MHLAFHGGKCCGIHIIHGFFYYPDDWAPSLRELGEYDPHLYGGEIYSPKARYFRDEAPRETYKERFLRYLAYLRKRNPGSLVEIVLSKEIWQNLWEPIMLGQGFEAVTSFTNSNSDNECTVYHLVIKDDGDDVW